MSRGRMVLFVGAIAGLALDGSASAAEELPALRVSGSHRALVTAEGAPFFWLGDTAWSLRQLAPADVDVYMARRAQDQFSVIQVHCGYDVADHAGARPFQNDDPDRPNEPFWQSIDDIVARARDHGLYIALVPMWGSEYGKAFGEDAPRARRFGEWIGRRYAGQSHVLWIVSGEYDAINGYRVPISDAQRSVLMAVAEGLRSAHNGAQLMTIHPGVARTSSLDFHDADWLDFNMLQSGHTTDCEAYGMAGNHSLIEHDWALVPTKPVLDGEPIYEDTPDGVWVRQDLNGPRADAAAVRRKAYWAVFAGAFGHTYGHNDMYCFFEPAFSGQVAGLPGQRGSWRAALDAPGAVQMKHVRALVESRPFLDRVPDPALVLGEPTRGLDHVQAIRAGNGSWAMAYIPNGKPTRISLRPLAGDRARAWWYDPRTGEAQRGAEYERRSDQDFEPPVGEAGQDWVLVLDDLAAGCSPPGRGPAPPPA